MESAHLFPKQQLVFPKQKGTVLMEELILPHSHSHSVHDDIICNLLSDVSRFESASEIFKQLSDPTRVRIFWLLSHKEECVINIAALMDMSSPAVSHHLHSLAESGLLQSRRDGKEVYYKAKDSEQINLLHEVVELVMAIACPENEISIESSPEEIVRNVHKYLMEHLSERITIEELSHKFLMNSTTLKKVFKDVYGTTIAAHMREHRMELAARLLKTTNEDVHFIARSVGYDSASRFTTSFKETYGVTPSEYRLSSQ